MKCALSEETIHRKIAIGVIELGTTDGRKRTSNIGARSQANAGLRQVG